jgi:hypothetical protein
MEVFSGALIQRGRPLDKLNQSNDLAEIRQGQPAKNKIFGLRRLVFGAAAQSRLPPQSLGRKPA